MAVTPPQKGSTTFGRSVAGIIGLTFGTLAAFYLLSDYELIKKDPPRIEYDENGNPIKPKFKVSFREMEPLKMRPEAIERLKAKQEYEEQVRKRLEMEKELEKMKSETESNK